MKRWLPLGCSVVAMILAVLAIDLAQQHRQRSVLDADQLMHALGLQVHRVSAALKRQGVVHLWAERWDAEGEGPVEILGLGTTRLEGDLREVLIKLPTRANEEFRFVGQGTGSYGASDGAEWQHARAWMASWREGSAVELPMSKEVVLARWMGSGAVFPGSRVRMPTCRPCVQFVLRLDPLPPPEDLAYVDNCRPREVRPIRSP